MRLLASIFSKIVSDNFEYNSRGFFDVYFKNVTFYFSSELTKIITTANMSQFFPTNRHKMFKCSAVSLRRDVRMVTGTIVSMYSFRKPQPIKIGVIPI